MAHRDDKKIQEGSVLEQLGATSFESLAPNIIEQIGSAFFKGVSLGQIDPLELSGREATIPGAEILGEFAGATIPIIRGFKLARLLIGAAENPSLVARLGQGAVVGGAFGGLEKISDERSRVASIIEGAAFFGGIEVGFGVLGKIGRLFKRKPGPLTETDKKALEKAVEKASPVEKESLEKAITSEKPTQEPPVSPVKDTAKRDKRVQENIERIEKAKPQELDPEFVKKRDEVKSLIEENKALVDKPFKVRKPAPDAKTVKENELITQREAEPLRVTNKQQKVLDLAKKEAKEVPLSVSRAKPTEPEFFIQTTKGKVEVFRRGLDLTTIKPKSPKAPSGEKIELFLDESGVLETNPKLKPSKLPSIEEVKVFFGEKGPTTTKLKPQKEQKGALLAEEVEVLLRETEGKAVPKPKAKPKGEPETIISFVRAAGRINPKSLAEKGITFENDRSTFMAVARKTGRGADDLAKTAVEEGFLPPGSTGEDLIKAIRAKKPSLKAKPKVEGREAPKAAEGKEVIQAGSLKVGDSFVEGGEKFTVTGKTKDKVTLQDGQKLELDLAATVEFDIGSITRATGGVTKKPILITEQGDQLSFASSVQATAPKGKIKPKEADKGSKIGLFAKPVQESGQKDLFVKDLTKSKDKLFSDKGGRFAIGALAGIEVDDKGNPTVNWVKAGAGLVTVGLAFNLTNNTNLRRSIAKFIRGLERKTPVKAVEEKTAAIKGMEKEAGEQKLDELFNKYIRTDDPSNWRKFQSWFAASADGYLRRLPKGKEVADAFQKVFDVFEPKAATLLRDLDIATKGFKDNDWALLRDLKTGKIKPEKVTPKIQSALPAIEKILNKVADDAEGVGILVGFRQNYWPQVNNWQILKSKRGYLSALKEIMNKGGGQSKEEAAAFLKSNLGPEAFSERALQRFMSKTGMTDSEAADILERYIHNNTRRISGNLERSRELDLQTARLSPKNEIKQYIIRSNRAIAEAKVYGKDLEKLNALIDEMKFAGEDWKFANSVKERLLGQSEADQRMMQIFGPLKSIQVLTKLGLAAIANASDFVNLSMVTNFKSMLKGLNKIMTSAEARDWNIRTGAAMESTTREMMDLEGMGFLQRAAGGMLKYTGFTPIERGLRLWGAGTAREYLPQIAQKLLKNPNKKRWIKSFEELSIDPKDVIAQGGKLTEDQLVLGAKRIADNAFKRYRVTDLPMFFNTPYGSLMFQFKKFAFTQGRLVKNEIKKGNPRVIGMFLAVFPAAGAAVGGIRAHIGGYERRGDTLSLERYIDNLTWVGSFGMVQDVVRSFRYRGGFESYFLGPTLTDVSVFGSSTYRSLNTGEPEHVFNFLKKQLPIVGRTAIVRPPKTKRSSLPGLRTIQQ